MSELLDRYDIRNYEELKNIVKITVKCISCGNDDGNYLGINWTDQEAVFTCKKCGCST